MIHLEGNELTVKLIVPYNSKENSLMAGLGVGWSIKLVRSNSEYIVCSSCEWNGYTIGDKELHEHYKIIKTGGK